MEESSSLSLVLCQLAARGFRVPGTTRGAPSRVVAPHITLSVVSSDCVWAWHLHALGFG